MYVNNNWIQHTNASLPAFYSYNAFAIKTKYANDEIPVIKPYNIN